MQIVYYLTLCFVIVESYGPSPPHEQRPFLMDAADFPGIPPRQYNPRPTPPGAMPGYVPFPLQQQRSPHIPQGFGQTPGLINSLDVSACMLYFACELYTIVYKIILTSLIFRGHAGTFSKLN